MSGRIEHAAGVLEALTTDPRVTVRRAGPPDPDGRCVVYWMQRAQRAVDNPALDTAVDLGNELGKPVVVFYGLNPFIAGGNLRHFHFLVEGLGDIADGLRKRRVGFVLRHYPDHHVVKFAEAVRASIVIGDENPLRQPEAWRTKAAELLSVPLWTVDADVIVPRLLLDKEEYAARTIRPRLLSRLGEFLTKPRDPVARVQWRAPESVSSLSATHDLLHGLPIDGSVGPVARLHGGTSAARRQLKAFVRERLSGYDIARNRPDVEGTSELSAYLHFGHIGPREIALAVRGAGGRSDHSKAFLEQLIVRRELAINYVTFNSAYDRLAGCERWALATLGRHRADRRPYAYSEEEFDAAATHDPLWNAAQHQMVSSGWMHGYLRMYWAKKILEWTRSPDEAFEVAVRLNDRYQLDGRDPSGYANIAWAIGGKHDRPWPERPIYGTVRTMSTAQTMKKFDARAYIERWASI